MKKTMLTGLAVAAVGMLALTACSSDSGSSSSAPANTGGGGSGDDVITVGFAQTGSESGWRSANTESMKTAGCVSMYESSLVKTMEWEGATKTQIAIH